MTQALMDCDKNYIIAETLARFTREEMIEALIEFEESWIEDANNSEIQEVLIDIWANGYNGKGWNNMTDKELAYEAIDALDFLGKYNIEENE
jgi:methionine salvage enolase-phosphatase E1